MIRRLSALLLVAGLVIGAVAPATAIAREHDRSKPDQVITKSDHARTKIHPRLLKQLDAGSTKEIRVFATVSGDPSAAEALVADAHVAKSGEAALVVGRIHVQALPKLAGVRGRRRSQPDRVQADRQAARQPGSRGRQATDRQGAEQGAPGSCTASEVPYSEAPPLTGSNFEALKKLTLLDAKTHNFTEAWKAATPARASRSASSTAARTSATPT